MQQALVEREPAKVLRVLLCGRTEVEGWQTDAFPQAKYVSQPSDEPSTIAQSVRESTPHIVVFHGWTRDAASLADTVRDVLRDLADASLILALEKPDDLLAGGFLKAGGYDVVDIVSGSEDLSASVRRAAERARLLARVATLEEQVRRKQRVIRIGDWLAEIGVLRDSNRRREFRSMIGASQPMQNLYERIELLAKFPDQNVTILGERGTGKSLVARALHDLGPRRVQPFKKFLCSRFQSADPRITMCELFGWGVDPPVRDLARAGGKGLIEQAGSGTIFLDELGDIPVLGQNLLLDVVENRTFSRPLGREDVVKVDVRFAFATNRSPKELIERGVLREDFWDRIRDFLVTVPPLRQRIEDIPLLVEHFLRHYNARFAKDVERLTEPAIERLKRHQWPGNVRELESAVRRALVLCDGKVIDERDLEIATQEDGHQQLDGLVERLWTLVCAGRMAFADVVEFKVWWGVEITRRLVERAVRTEGSLKQAGVLLGVYSDASAESHVYAKFRNDVARLGVSAPGRRRAGGSGGTPVGRGRATGASQ